MKNDLRGDAPTLGSLIQWGNLLSISLMQEALRNAEQQVPKNLMKERKLEDGSTVHEVGPIVYGYSVKIGQDGKPLVRKFGNVVFSPGFIGSGISVKEQHEPLVDIISGSENITVVAELPGVIKIYF